jgi:signal peptidase I
MTSQLEKDPRYSTLIDEASDTEDWHANAKWILREIVETAVLTLVIFFLVRLAFQNFRIEMQSMEPNLHEGQSIIANKLVYHLHPPERGDVIVFHAPANPGKDYIKRVVALPGEEVRIREGQVYVNGARLEETYATRPSNSSWGPEVVGELEYFVLGDNRNYSSDSRNWGMLDRDAIVGKAWLSYWPPQEWGLVPHYSFVSG